MSAGSLLPDPAPYEAPFWEWCAEGELRVQQCRNCGVLRFPPRPGCASCESVDATWVRLSGKGRIWSFVIAHPPLLPAYEALAPYPVVVVELDEDRTLRMVGNVVDGTEAAIDLPVEVTFEEVGEMTLPRWRARTT